MKFEDISFIFAAIALIIYIAVCSVNIKENTERIECLNNKLDSITINNNYSYSHITTFENKTPEEGIDEALLYYDIKHPTIVKAQAILETAHFSSDLCVKNNNLFGLYDSKNKRYY